MKMIHSLVHIDFCLADSVKTFHNVTSVLTTVKVTVEYQYFTAVKDQNTFSNTAYKKQQKRDKKNTNKETQDV